MANSDGSSGRGPTGLQGMGLGALDVGNLLDSVEFVKNAWSSFGVPSSLAPTVDVDELDRRIADLKAVEQWLRMNLNLLEASVRALEVQRGTIATLRAYGDMLGAQAQGLPGAQALAQAMADVAAGAMAGATGAGPASGDPSIPAAASPPAARTPRTPADEMAAAASGEAPPKPAPAAAAPGLDASAWWELLNRQFNQIAAAALGAGAAGVGESAAGESAADDSATRTPQEGAPVARSSRTPSGEKTRKTSSADEPGRRGRRPAR